MSVALIGVDIGTTNIKAVAFSLDGAQLAKSSRPTQTNYPRPDWAEFDHKILWQTIVDVIRGVVEQLGDKAKPAAIAFTGMAEAGLPLDEADKPLYPAITWYDRRVLPQMQQWEDKIGAAETARITGLPLAPAAGILRPLWLRDNEVQIFAKTRKWLNLPDYAAFKLCGAKVTEYSLASRMMALDLDTKSWSGDLLEKAELDMGLLGELAPSAVQIGKVSGEAVELTGLPYDLPVCTAGHDHLCAAVGLGAAKTGDIFDSIGTAEAVVTSLKTRATDPKIASSGIAQGIHVLPNSYYAISGNSFGGGSIDWVRELLHGDLRDQDEAFEILIKQAADVPAGCGGAFFLPHLRQANPPILDPASRGAFIGLSSDSGPGHMARAVMEGLAFEYQRILDALSDSFGSSGRRMVAAGGGTRNALFMQIKADVSGLPITVPDIEEATCLGAALAAGIGAGVYSDYDDAVDQIKVSQTIFEPNDANHAFYRERYEKVYVHIYDALKSINHNISHWVSAE